MSRVHLWLCAARRVAIAALLALPPFMVAAYASPAVAQSPPIIQKKFAIGSIFVGASTSLFFTITNPNAGASLSGVGFTDSLPAGVIVATPNGLSGSCGGGGISATAGSGSISLSGATLAAGDTCTFSVEVTGTTTGLKKNTTSAVTSIEGGDGNFSTASLTVTPAPSPPSIAKVFNDATIAVGASTVLAFLITNPNASAVLTGVGFTDSLPAGLIVGTPNGLTGDCTGSVSATAGSGSISLSGQKLGPGASCKFAVNVTGTTAGIKKNITSTVTSSEGGNGNAATASLTVNAPPSLAKTVAAIHRFLGLRNDLLLSNAPVEARQVDRLLGAEMGNNGQGAGPPSQIAPTGAFASGRLGTSFDAAEIAGTRTARTERQFGPGFDHVGGNAPLSGAAAAPFNLLGQEEGPARLSFSTSFSQIVRAASAAEANARNDPLGLAATQALPGHTPLGPWDFWVEGHYASIGDDRNGLSLKGSFGVLYLGTDYIVSPSFLIGALVQFDSLRQTSHVLSTDVDGWGWMAGPYATIRLSKHLFLQGRAAWGRSNNSISPFMTYEDHFTSNRWLASSTLTGRWQFGPWQFRPIASIAYIEDTSNAYVDTLGVSIPSVRSTLGQAKFGPEIGYRIILDGGVLEPHASLQGIWNFARSGNEVVADTAAGPDEWRGKVEVGIKAITPSGITFDLSGSYDGIGSGNWQAIVGRLSLRAPLN